MIVAVLAVTRMRHFVPQTSSGCLVSGRSFDVTLTPSQAAIAATIAGVAAERGLPRRAVTIAYATALQESDLQNLPYGDRDSVGVFQQRPSQGWGPRKDLLDPAYAAGRFFAALAAVPGYQRMRIDQAAQAVQRSADGSAYGQYAPQGTIMSDGFTGQQPHAVWCWYTGGVTGRGRLAAASGGLVRAFGHLKIGHAKDPAVVVRPSSAGVGWSMAAWLVTNASDYRIRYVRYQGLEWTASSGQRGWAPAAAGHSRPQTGRSLTFGW